MTSTSTIEATTTREFQRLWNRTHQKRGIKMTIPTPEADVPVARIRVHTDHTYATGTSTDDHAGSRRHGRKAIIATTTARSATLNIV
jgi:hypothetical protein